MKRLIIIFVFLWGLCSCNTNSLTEDTKPTKPSTPTLQVDDICGVWIDLSNDLYYIAIYPNGHYTYCLNNKLIGSGHYKLEQNKLILNNSYTYSSDAITIKKSSLKLTLDGYISDHNRNKEFVSKTFTLNNAESLSPSATGARLSTSGGLSVHYDNLRETLEFISDYILKYEYTGRSKTTGQYKTIRQYTWYYTYRKPYTYAIKLNNDDNIVEIYNFNFVYTPNWGALDIDLDSYRIQ